MRKLELNINNCRECPFCNYDPHYSMSKDSGYDCSNPNSQVTRIADDWEISKYNKRLEEIEEQNKSLFKYEGEIPRDPFTIPDKCPLEKI